MKRGRTPGKNTISHSISFQPDVEARILQEMAKGPTRAYLVNKAVRILFNLPEPTDDPKGLVQR